MTPALSLERPDAHAKDDSCDTLGSTDQPPPVYNVNVADIPPMRLTPGCMVELGAYLWRVYLPSVVSAGSHFVKSAVGLIPRQDGVVQFIPGRTRFIPGYDRAK